jgi:hypothetical protein
MGKAEEVLNPNREFYPPAIDFARLIPFPVPNSLFDAIYPSGLQHQPKGNESSPVNQQSGVLSARKALLTVQNQFRRIIE